MFSRAFIRAASSSRASMRTSFRSMHTSPSLNASRRTAWIAGTSAALGLYGLHVATQDSMRLDGAAVSEPPTSIPPTIDAKVAEVASVSVEPTASEPASTVTDAAETTSAEETAPAAEPTEEEDPKSAAFDPVTGEINWDCPCLGGMAHGPCGEEFRAAFSCFVYSEGEPKGIDCVEKFKGMQDCFRAHPDVYGEEIADEEELDSGNIAEEPEPVEEPPKRKWRSRYED